MKIKVSIPVLVISLFISSLTSSAQKTIINDPPRKTYSEALQLFEQENYGAASAMFEQVKKEISDPANAFYENAAFYNTMCAVYLGEKNALKQVEEFNADYPESGWLPAIQFELGKLYFTSRKYKQALNAFNDVRPAQLSRDQRTEYNYKRGVSLLELGKTDAAQKSLSKVTGTSSSYAVPAKFYIAHIDYEKGNYQKALTGFKSLENNRRFSKQIPNYLVHIYYELGDYQKVVEDGAKYYQKADSKSKGQIAGLIGNALFNLGDYGNSLKYFEFYERSSRKKISAEENYRIGYAKFMSEKYHEAIHNFQEASRENEDLAQNAWYYLGFCYLKTSEAKFAQNAFMKAYKLQGDDKITTDALYNYVKVTIESGGDLYNNPVEIVEDFIEKNPDLPRIDEAYDLLAQLYLTSRQYKAALESIEKTRNPNRKLQAIYQQIAFTQGIEYFNRAEYEEAIGYFDKSLFYTPDDELEAQTVFWYADALYRMKNYKDATAKYHQFLKMPTAKQTVVYTNAAYNLAYTYFNRKQYSRAIDYFGRFVKQNNTNINLVSDAKLRLADSYFISKDYTRALNWYNQVISENSRNADYALYQKANCYGAQGNFDKKVSTLKTFVSNNKSSILYDDALFEIASTSLILNDQRTAINYYDKLVKEKPNSSFAKKALVKMGLVYYKGNQYDRAATTLKQVVSKYPASLEAKEALITLQNIYMDQGRVDEYFAYAKSLDFVQVSISEEDSLTFVTGENYYMNGDYNNAINALENYLKQFPNGGFVLSSFNYLANSFEKQGQVGQSMNYYQKIIEYPENQYSDMALLKSARYAFDKKEYENALKHYQRLGESAENKGMILEGQDGAMRCSYLLNDFTTAKNYSEALLTSPMATDEQVLFAHYIAAKSHLELDNLTDAEKEFAATDELTSNELGAESKFQVAQINFDRNQLDVAENQIYDLAEQYPDYAYWIAKGFILLSDIYMARDNAFQAEQTLQSVIENYPGEDLKTVAREKLALIKPAEPGPESSDDESENE